MGNLCMKFQVSLLNITDAKFQSPNFQRRAITLKLSYNFFSSNFHQIFYSSSPINWHKFQLSTSNTFWDTALTKLQHDFSQRAVILQGEIILEKNIHICYFFMGNPFMKFQDDISKNVTDTHTYKPKPICPPLFQSWGIINLTTAASPPED